MPPTDWNTAVGQQSGEKKNNKMFFTSRYAYNFLLYYTIHNNMFLIFIMVVPRH